MFYRISLCWSTVITTDFLVSFSLFGKFDHFEDQDAAEEKNKKEHGKEEIRYEEELNIFVFRFCFFEAKF